MKHHNKVTPRIGNFFFAIGTFVAIGTFGTIETFAAIGTFEDIWNKIFKSADDTPQLSNS